MWVALTLPLVVKFNCATEWYNFLLKVQQVTKQKFGLFENYRPILSYPPFDWCQVMYDAERNPTYKFAVQAVSNSVPNLLHYCPYWVLSLSFATVLAYQFISRAQPTRTTWLWTWIKFLDSFQPANTWTQFWCLMTSIGRSLKSKSSRLSDNQLEVCFYNRFQTTSVPMCVSLGTLVGLKSQDDLF